MGNCLPLGPKKGDPLPIESTFKLPSPLPSFPSGGGFAKGSINLGGLEVCQISTFIKVWATHEGGPDNLGATFFKPSKIPSGFFTLGYFCQPNNRSLFGWVLVGKDDGNNDDSIGGVLAKPVDYTLVWNSKSLNIKQDGDGYIWLPTPPQGYASVGLIVTTSPDKPSVDEIRCVRSDLTDACENDMWIWGTDDSNNSSDFNIYGLRPTNRGIQALGVSAGTFGATTVSSLACLKNKDSNLSSMPNLTQIEALMKDYSPWIYFYPDESYLPSSVNWFFNNGALLYRQDEPTPSPVDLNGSNLPQGGSDDGTYWLDLPVDADTEEKVKRGDLQSSQSYLHIKPMLGATFTDIAIWIFYPFNGPSRAKVDLVTIPFKKIGEHIGDWEHLTLRISNFTGELWRVYFSQHSKGKWVDASELEFQGGNKVVSYSSLNGHAFYSKPGLVLQGLSQLGIGIRNDTAKSNLIMDTGARFEVVAAQYLDSVIEPPWINYSRKWGPKINYLLRTELNEAEEVLPEKLKSALESLVHIFPSEIFGEEGPTGPKMKTNWDGDEKV